MKFKIRTLMLAVAGIALLFAAAPAINAHLHWWSDIMFRMVYFTGGLKAGSWLFTAGWARDLIEITFLVAVSATELMLVFGISLGSFYIFCRAAHAHACWLYPGRYRPWHDLEE